MNDMNDNCMRYWQDITTKLVLHDKRLRAIEDVIFTSATTNEAAKPADNIVAQRDELLQDMAVIKNALLSNGGNQAYGTRRCRERILWILDNPLESNIPPIIGEMGETYVAKPAPEPTSDRFYQQLYVAIPDMANGCDNVVPATPAQVRAAAVALGLLDTERQLRAERILTLLQRNYNEPECYEMTANMFSSLAYRADQNGACDSDVTWLQTFSRAMKDEYNKAETGGVK